MDLVIYFNGALGRSGLRKVESVPSFVMLMLLLRYSESIIFKAFYAKLNYHVKDKH